MWNSNPYEKAPGKQEKACPVCEGSGEDKKGDKCKTCLGTGTVNK